MKLVLPIFDAGLFMKLVLPIFDEDGSMIDRTEVELTDEQFEQFIESAVRAVELDNNIIGLRDTMLELNMVDDNR